MHTSLLNLATKKTPRATKLLLNNAKKLAFVRIDSDERSVDRSPQIPWTGRPSSWTLVNESHLLSEMAGHAAESACFFLLDFEQEAAGLRQQQHPRASWVWNGRALSKQLAIEQEAYDSYLCTSWEFIYFWFNHVFHVVKPSEHPIRSLWDLVGRSQILHVNWRQ